MRPTRWTSGVGLRIALAALAVAALGVGIVAVGVLVVGSTTFAELMVEHGASAESAHAMFDESVTVVLVAGIAVASLAATVAAIVLGRRLVRPLIAIETAARRIAAGDLAVRAPRGGAREIDDLAASFNSMAESLEAGERVRHEFIANASHELRTPLTNLKGYLEGLRDGVFPLDEATLSSLSEEVERLVRLATSLDALAAAESATAPGVVELDVNAAIRTAADVAGPAMERAGITLDVRLPAKLTAKADPDGLAQVLANLLQNATRYTPADGTVWISATRDGSTAVVSVENSGVEIPQADLPHLFERFYRVDKSRDQAHGGAGIGLAIVEELVEAAGGAVGVESSTERTRFWFSLPT